MKTHLHPKQLFLISIFWLTSIACQDDPVSEELVDKDMIAATQLAEEFLSTTNGRLGKKSITVLRFQNGNLLYDTNTDDISEYRVVNEETITAIVEPGEYVFWYAGDGVSDLDGIEFDGASQQQLYDSPEEIELDLLWVQWIPENANSFTGLLKYDIIYQFAGNNGPAIRLDPKIQL